MFCCRENIFFCRLISLVFNCLVCMVVSFSFICNWFCEVFSCVFLVWSVVMVLFVFVSVLVKWEWLIFVSIKLNIIIVIRFKLSKMIVWVWFNCLGILDRCIVRFYLDLVNFKIMLCILFVLFVLFKYFYCSIDFL